MEVMYFDVNCTCKPKKSFKRYVQFNKIAKHFDENCKIKSGDNGVYRLTTSHDAAKHIEKILKIININNINAEAAKAYYDLHKGLEGSKWFSDDDSSTTHVVTDSVDDKTEIKNIVPSCGCNACIGISSHKIICYKRFSSR